MREIKFKAWDKKNKTMHDEIQLQHSVGKWSAMPYGTNSKRLENFILLQYTDLKDKNGVEMCEGDILGVPNPTIKYVIKFGEYHYNIDYDTCENGVGFYMETVGNEEEKRCLENINYIRVIGNMYENPELLK